MATSSAEPEKLFRYSDVTLTLDHEVKSESTRLAGTLGHFEAACREPGFRLSVGHLASALSSYGGECETVGSWVRRVGTGFLAADSGGFTAILLQTVRWRPWHAPLSLAVWLGSKMLAAPSWLSDVVRTLPWIASRPAPVVTPAPEPFESGAGSSRRTAPVEPEARSGFGPPTAKNLEESKYLKFGAVYQDGPYVGKAHKGVDIDGIEGEEIHPIGAGTVVECRTQLYESGSGWGHTVVIEHKLSDGTSIYSRYAHLQELPNLEVGASVDPDTVIGKMGNSGTELVHLHLEVSRSHPATDWIDPASVIGNPEWQIQS